MKLNRTYGKIILEKGEKATQWRLFECAPHVCIKLKAIFRQIGFSSSQPFHLTNTIEFCNDMLWFIQRYPLQISEQDLKYLKKQAAAQVQKINDLEEIMHPDRKPRHIVLKEGYEGRDYQLRGTQLYMKTERLLCGDDLGLGKTLIAILSFLEEGTLPAAVVVQTHLKKQWCEQIEKFTNLRTHIVKGTKPYNLPDADVYVISYSCLAGWMNFFETKFFNSAVFDEVQELRHTGTNKYNGGQALSDNSNFVLGLTATPIYNYGEEIYNILNLIKPGCLGDLGSFQREWTGYSSNVKDPAALGTYLRENFLFLRRTREEVGRELPPVNKIVHTVDYDHDEAEKSTELARKLAIKVVSGSFMERGQAARDLDIMMRQSTGVAKAHQVAQYVRILLENNEPVLLAGWHRDVYDIWQEELKEFKPLMYTGSESPKQKEDTKKAFINGDSNLMIISLRSGVGLDGLQFRCKYVVFGELDWSPKVHDQVIARADRDGQVNQVTAIYLVTEYGSDPVIIDLLGLKASESHNIIDPLKAVPIQHSDESRIKILAQSFLKKKELETVKEEQVNG